MLDIETWSTRHDALIVEIGAVKFDATKIIDRFTVSIDPVDAQKRYGRHIDAATVLYWMQEKMAQPRAEWLETGKVDLFSAVDGFLIWTAQTPVDERGSLWGKGSTFDNVLLKDTIDALGLEWPFSYKQDECYRTFANRCPEVKFKAIGTAHRGVVDAESQAVHLQAICKDLDVKL